MISKLPYIILVFFASIFLYSSAYRVSLPTNYTWPLNSKKLCFAGRFDLVMNVDYLQSDGTKASVSIPLNNGTFESYRVSCSVPANIHELTLSMLNGFSAILFDFSIDNQNITSLTKVYGYVTINDQQNIFKNYSNATLGVHRFSSNETLFVAARGNSYRCNTKTSIKGFNTSQIVSVTSIDVENLRIQPFIDDATEFSDYGVEKVCAADIDKTSNLIPIIVGSCLALLVVVVLTAYLIGRRHRRSGYQTV